MERECTVAHLATRWRCSPKEESSLLHSLAVALRGFSKAGTGRGQLLYLRLPWTVELFGGYCLLCVYEMLLAGERII